MPRKRLHRLLFVSASLLALQLGSSPSLAQQYSGGGGNDEYYSSHEEYADGRYRPDDLYANYMNAASNTNGGKAVTKKNAMVKLALTFSGGWIGAKAHTFLKMRRSAPPKLRFRVGERVLCHMGNDQWARGSIVKLWPQQGKGQYAPYLVRLDDRGATNKKKGSKKNPSKDGQIIYAPADNEGVIRAAR